MRKMARSVCSSSPRASPCRCSTSRTSVNKSRPIRWSLMRPSSCGSDGWPGGCRGRCRCRWRASSRIGAGSRGCRAGRRRGRRGRTSSRRWPCGGRWWRRRARRGCGRGHACPTTRRRGRSTASRSFGLTVRASPRTSWLTAVSRTPRARAMRAEPWPMTWRARSRSRVPPASARPRGTVALATARMAVVVPQVGLRRPAARPETVAGARPAVVAMAW